MPALLLLLQRDTSTAGGRRVFFAATAGQFALMPCMLLRAAGIRSRDLRGFATRMVVAQVALCTVQYSEGLVRGFFGISICLSMYRALPHAKRAAGHDMVGPLLASYDLTQSHCT